MQAFSSSTQKLNAIINLFGRAQARLGILKISYSSGAKMGCLQYATAVRLQHAYPSLCNYLFPENNLQKQLGKGGVQSTLFLHFKPLLL